MRRLKHIDARLARWARWCESGGRLSVAPFARGMRVDNGRGESDAALIHGEEWETQEFLRLLAFADLALVTALYRVRFQMLELAYARTAPASGRPLERICAVTGISVDAVRQQLCIVDRQLDAMLHARREGRDVRTALKRPPRRPSVRVRAEVGGRRRTIASAAPGEIIS